MHFLLVTKLELALWLWHKMKWILGSFENWEYYLEHCLEANRNFYVMASNFTMFDSHYQTVIRVESNVSLIVNSSLLPTIRKWKFKVNNDLHLWKMQINKVFYFFFLTITRWYTNIYIMQNKKDMSPPVNPSLCSVT